MEAKEMTVADLNLVFGKAEEPLLKHIDDIFLPALTSGIDRVANDNTRYIFEQVCLAELNGEYVVQGILIKDTTLDIMSEYSEINGLQKTDKHFKAAPYSVFIIYLKNHRMVLVKNQSGSPNIRTFTACLRDVLKEYVSRENDRRRSEELPLLPHQRLNIAGIKTAENVKETLKNVEKIKEITFQFYPLNGEWDYEPVFGGIDQMRKNMGAKKGKMVFGSPGSIEGVAEAIENTEGLAKTKLKVVYKDDLSLQGKSKRIGTIKDDEISDISHIDVENELNEAFQEIAEYKKNVRALNVESKNGILLYEEFAKKKKGVNK